MANKRELLRQVMDRIRGGKYGFYMGEWFVRGKARTKRLHQLRVPLNNECRTAFCLAGHIASVGGYSPIGGGCRRKGGIPTTWASAADRVWSEAYPGADITTLHELYYYMNITSLRKLEGLLRPLAVK